MKLRKEVQGVLVFIAVASTIAILTTIDSAWSFEYIVFFLANLSILVGSSLILKKFGRWN